MLTSREFFVKSYLEEEVVPFLDTLFNNSDPLKYQIYQGNACRQYAVYASALLDELLPNFIWEVWEGRMSHGDKEQSRQYEHFWIYGKESNGNRKLLIDLSRHPDNRLFTEVPKNRFPENHSFYQHLNVLWRRQLPAAERLAGKEFYTGLEQLALLEDIKTQCDFYDFLSELENFTLIKQEQPVSSKL